MGRKYSWNADQLAFLKSHLEEYITLYKAKKGYEAFWVMIRREFNTAFPFLEGVFPGREEASLNADELKQYDVYRESILTRIYSFYRREADKSRKALMEVNQPNGSTKKPRKRVYQAAEIYSKMYFKRRLKKQYEEEKKIRNLDNRAALGLKTKIARQRFLEEDDATVAKVLKRLKKENEIIQGGVVSDPTPADYQRAIKGIPAYLHSVLFPLMKSTCFTFTVLMGGPSPAKGGKIVTSSFHEIGPGVSLTYGETDGHTEVIKSYSKYIKSEYDADFCKSLAMTSDDTQEYQDLEKWSSEEDDTESDDEDTDDESDVDDVDNNISVNEACNKKKTNTKSNTGSQPEGHSKAASAVEATALIPLDQAFINRNATPSPSSLPIPPIASIQSSATCASSFSPSQAQAQAQASPTKGIILAVLAEPSPSKQPSPSKIVPLQSHISSVPIAYPGILTNSQGTNIVTGTDLPIAQQTLNFTQYQQQTPSLPSQQHPLAYLNFDGLPSNAFDANLQNNSFLQFGRENDNLYPFIDNSYSLGDPLFGNNPVQWGPPHMMLPSTSGTSQNSNPPQPVSSSIHPPATAPPLSTHSESIPAAPDVPILQSASIPATPPVPISQPDPIPTAPPVPSVQPTHEPAVTGLLPMAVLATNNSALTEQPTTAPTPIDSIPPTDPQPALPLATVISGIPVIAPQAIVVPSESGDGQLAPPSSASEIPPPNSTTSVTSHQPVTPDIVSATPDIQPAPNASMEVSLPAIATASICTASSSPLTAAVTADTSDEGSNDTLSMESRSKRPKKPSTRNEKMDMIGTTVVPPPRAPTPTDIEAPEWFTVTKDHLLQQTFGEPWSDLVTAWYELEGLLGYGSLSGAKTGLPASDRPSEWVKWTSKTRNGPGRVLTQPPYVQDPAEIGLAIVKWWNALQPSFRQSESSLPLPISTPPPDDQDIWGSLRRAGPNGLVSIILLLEWWGLALPSRTQFQEDSTSLWQEMLVDVTNTLGVLKSSATMNTKSKKRKASEDESTESSKKTRTSTA